MTRRSQGRMISRRDALAAIGAFALATPLGLRAQRPGKPARIGWLGPASQPYDAATLEAFHAGMRKLGHSEGTTYSIESRWADGNYERLPSLAAELAALKVDVVVARNTPAAQAANNATATIPIVMAPAARDPVGAGLVASLRRPGGNVTGLTASSTDVSTKWLELIREITPRAQRVVYLFNPGNGTATEQAMHAAAKSLKLQMVSAAVADAAQFDAAFGAIAKARADALAVQADTMFASHEHAIAGKAAQHRLPSIGSARFARAGGLVGYGAATRWDRVAVFVDKILKGARPGDLPVEQAPQFELVANSVTAKAIGLAIPQSILLRADRVIG